MRKLLVCVRTVVTAVFDIVMEEDKERVKIVTLRVDARVKEGKGGGGGEKKYSPTFSSQFRVSTWRVHEQNIRTPEENACTVG